MNPINEKTSLIHVMSLGIGKTLYQTGMVFNIRARTRIDTLVYPYIPAQHWLENETLQFLKTR
jgi:hypothetical protein